MKLQSNVDHGSKDPSRPILTIRSLGCVYHDKEHMGAYVSSGDISRCGDLVELEGDDGGLK
jgi:hypothetical protein